MNKKLTKVLSIFLIAGLIGTGAAVGAVGCSQSSEDPGKQEEVATVTGVTVTAAGNATSVTAGGTLQLSAAVAGTNSPAQTVTWTIKDGATATGATVSENGILTAGNVAGTVTVVATSTYDTTKSGEITITVNAGESSQGTVTGVVVDAKDYMTEGESITLEALVTGTATDKTVTWSIVSGSEYATLAGATLTANTAGTVVIRATSNADTSKYQEATITISAKVLTMYDTLAAQSNVILTENFDAKEADSTLSVFEAYGTKGIYVSSNTAAPVKVTSTGTLSIGASTGGGLVDAIVDYGATLNQEIEGYLEVSVSSTATQTNKPLIVFESGKGNEVLSILYSGSSSTNIAYKVNGATTAPAVEIAGNTSLDLKVYYKFNIVTGTFTLKINDSEVFNNQAISVDGTVGVTGVKISAHNSGKGVVILDNVVVCATEMTLDGYKTATNNKVSALENTYGFGTAKWYYSSKGLYESSVEAATTIAEVDTAYSALYASVLGAYIDLADYHVNQELWTEGYTHDATLVEALKSAITDEIYELTKIEDAYTYATSDFADRLEAAGIHEDSYYGSVDVTVVIYEKDTTTSVVKSTADLTDKDGEEITLATLKDAIEVPSGKAIKGLYSDAACTTAITGSLTLDAGEATTATTMTIYVEFGDVVVYSADNCGLEEAATIADATNAAFSVSATTDYKMTALVAAGGGTTAAANDNSGRVFSSALVATGTSKPLTITAKEDIKLIVYYTTTNSDFNNKSQTKGGYLTWTINGDTENAGSDTNTNNKDGRTAYACEITLKAGDVCVLNSSTNRLALFGLVAIC
ncbi:MAG: hypothetical protein ACI4VK_04825 [Candidatus Coproplasma sp.]